MVWKQQEETWGKGMGGGRRQVGYSRGKTRLRGPVSDVDADVSTAGRGPERRGVVGAHTG